MISLVLPYYDRQEATDDAMKFMATHYADIALEVILVDDGSPEPYVPPVMPFPLVIVRLQKKYVPLNPCTPINEGAKYARGEYIAISNPEILHLDPVLEQMRNQIAADGPKTYVLAACWCPEQRRWHCHTSQQRRNDSDVGAYLPTGANYHFMAMMHRSLWEETGGFDEDYRDGAGYDDPDFVRRLHKAGANFVIRDDLVVLHPRKGARADWTAEMNQRNRQVFLSKWQPI
jgi:GT2 family glycosyltransferase